MPSPSSTCYIHRGHVSHHHLHTYHFTQKQQQQQQQLLLLLLNSISFSFSSFPSLFSHSNLSRYSLLPLLHEPLPQLKKESNMALLEARVKSVLSGDTLILTHVSNPSQERTLSLAYVSAPRLRREGDEVCLDLISSFFTLFTTQLSGSTDHNTKW